MKSHASIHWSQYIKRDSTTDIEKLENFRNNNLSYGLDDFIDDNYGKILFEKLIKELKENYVLKFFNNKNIGKSKSFFIYKNKIIHYSHLFFVKWISILEKKIDLKKDINLICEIGGGYGGLIEKILMISRPKVILIDLEITNQLSYYYLTENFPDLVIRKFNFNDTKNFKLSDLHGIDIAILAPDIHIDKDIEIDLFINSRSFSEMEKKTIDSYYKFINTNISDNGYFLNINRYVKRSVGYNISLFRFPYGHYWKAIHSDFAWHQNKIHYLLCQKVSFKNPSFKKTIQVIKKNTLLQRKEDFKELIKNKLPNNPLKKTIVLFLESFFYIAENILPYWLYVALSKIKYYIIKNTY